MTELLKRFRRCDREGTAVLESLRKALKDVFRLYREFTVFSKSGGRSGDLGEEIMDYERYTAGSEGGCNTGSVYLYSVVDHNTNGYSHSITVLIDLPDEYKDRAKLIQLLEQNEFVSSYSSFKERTFGSHRHRQFLDSVPDLNCSAFKCER